MSTPNTNDAARETGHEVIYYKTGESLDLAYIGRDRWGNLRGWFLSELRKDGKPNRVHSGRRISEHASGRRFDEPFVVTVLPAREAQAAPIRAEIAAINEALSAAEARLLAVYTPVEGI